MGKKILIGPFYQLLTMAGMPVKGALRDSALNIIPNGGLLIEGDIIIEAGDYNILQSAADADTVLQVIEGKMVAFPGFIDCHTHIAFSGSRANDFALRNAGSTYLEIAAAGGGIWNTVSHTRNASEEALVALTVARANELLAQGVTTVEVKSGYGLSITEELKILRAIKKAGEQTAADLIPTCLAAHTLPKDFPGSHEAYLQEMMTGLFPLLQSEKLTNRVDAFIETGAFAAAQIAPYFKAAQEAGFDITVHADQFTTSGSQIAVDFGAVSADHLEASTGKEIQLLAGSDVVAVALPGASLGLGCAFTPARKLLDAGAAVAIATDWNPGSAPMGQLVATASILATMQKLTNAETLAAISFRAAAALNLKDRGVLEKDKKADFILYDTDNYQDILYAQGRLQPSFVWKNGVEVYSKK